MKNDSTIVKKQLKKEDVLRVEVHNGEEWYAFKTHVGTTSYVPKKEAILI